MTNLQSSRPITTDRSTGEWHRDKCQCQYQCAMTWTIIRGSFRKTRTITEYGIPEHQKVPDPQTQTASDLSQSGARPAE